MDPESESPATERLGRIYIHHVRDQTNEDVTEVTREDDASNDVDKEQKTAEDVSFTMMEQLECAAVLDMTWCAAHLAVVTAGGRLQLSSYSESEEERTEEKLLSLESEVAVTEGLALALGRCYELLLFVRRY